MSRMARSSLLPLGLAGPSFRSSFWRAWISRSSRSTTLRRVQDALDQLGSFAPRELLVGGVDDVADRDAGLRSPSLSAWSSRLARFVDMTARVTPSLPSSIRLARAISPSRVRSETRPISRRYIRTGSSVRPMGPGVRSIGSRVSAWTVSSRSSRESSISSGMRAALALVDDVDVHGPEHHHDVVELVRVQVARAGRR